MLVREFATDHFDLPHDFVATESAGICSCSRDLGDPLHQPSIAEKASAATPFPRETGS